MIFKCPSPRPQLEEIRSHRILVESPHVWQLVRTKTIFKTGPEQGTWSRETLLGTPSSKHRISGLLVWAGLVGFMMDLSRSCDFLPGMSIPSVRGSPPHRNLSSPGPPAMALRPPSPSQPYPVLPLPSHQPLSILSLSRSLVCSGRDSASPPHPPGAAFVPSAPCPPAGPPSLSHRCPLGSASSRCFGAPPWWWTPQLWDLALLHCTRGEKQLWQKLQGPGNHHSLFCATPPGLECSLLCR